MTYTIPSIYTAVDKFSGPMKAMANSAATFAAKSQRAATMVNGYFNKILTPVTKLRNALGEIGIYIGLYQLTRALRSAFNTIADFEQANVNLKSVTDPENRKFLGAMSDQARAMAVSYGIAAKEVSNLQYELTKKGFNGQQILNMTPAIALGATAFRASADDVSDYVGGVLKAFNMDSSKALEVVNKTLKAANLTAADFESYKTQLPIIARVAQQSKVSLTEVLAVLGALRDVQIHTATGSTSFKNFLLDNAAKYNLTFEQALDKLMKAQEKGKLLSYTFDKYGKKTVVSAIELVSQYKRIKNELIPQINAVEDNYVNILAGEQLNTLKGRLKLLGTAWDELILAIDQGNGPIGKAAKSFLDTARAVLLMASGSDIAAKELAKMSGQTIESAKKWLFWLNVAKWVIGAILAIKAVMFLWAAVTQTIIVLSGIITFATQAWAAAQWLLNVAMMANPIGLIVAGVLLLLAVVLKAIESYHDWGAAVLMLLGPFGWFINMVMTLINHWDRMIKAFKDGGFLSGIKAIGIAILDFILLPLQQILAIVAKFTGFEWANNLSKQVTAFRTSLVGDASQVQKPLPIVNPREGQYSNSILDGQVDVNIKDPGNYVESIKSDSSFLMPRVSTTLPFAYGSGGY